MLSSSSPSWNLRFHLPLLSSTSFVMFILLYHSSLSSSLLFFSSSLSFVILFFVQSLFFRNSSLLFLSSSHIFILPYRRVIVLLLLSSFLSLCYLHPYRSYRPFSFLYRFLYVSSSLVSPFPPSSKMSRRIEEE